MLQSSCDDSSHHNTGRFQKIETEEASYEGFNKKTSSKSQRRKTELGIGLLSPSEDDDRRVIQRQVSHLQMQQAKLMS